MKKIDVKTIYAGIFGVAVGDAVGVPYEFKSREIIAENPAVDMIGHGTYDLPKGFWSDDTSMTLAMLDGMSEWRNEEDYNAVMERFSEWYFEDKYTPDDEMFDCGNTCSIAIHNYKRLGMNIDECGLEDEYSNGNGGLMRIIPALFYVHFKYGENWIGDSGAINTIEKLTALTHAHKRSRIASVMYLSVAEEILKGKNKKDAVIDGLTVARVAYLRDVEGLPELCHFERVLTDDFECTPLDEIRGGGYVVDSLEAAVWAFLNTDSYKACILKSVNLGDDTDTIAAIAGGLAGLFYGLKGIPEKWLSDLARFWYIKELCDKYYDTIKNI